MKLAPIAAVIALAALSLTATPAQASETKTQTICHYDNGQGGKYTQQTVAKASITKAGHGDHAADIIAPFTWDDGGNDYGTYPGLNWTTANQALWANGCNPANAPLAPVLPTQPQATCLRTDGDLVIPEQVAGVTVTSKVTSAGYVLTYTKPADTIYNTYVWADGFTGTATILPLPVLTTDPLWDAAHGICRMPDTGGGISNAALMLGGGALGLGMIAVAGASMINRRKVEK